MQFQVEVAGVDSLLLRFMAPVDEGLLETIACCTQALQSSLGDVLLDIVPSYSTILLTYNLLKISDSEIRQQINAICQEAVTSSVERLSSKEVCLPVCYEHSHAPDMSALSEKLGLSVQQIIDLHSEDSYRVYAVGFTPGFAYLGELCKELRVPRLATPRLKVPAGSVAIAESNTAVYPQQTPGGWWLIGRCPFLLFDKNSNPPVKLQTGDKVRFEPISTARYEQLRQF